MSGLRVWVSGLMGWLASGLRLCWVSGLGGGGVLGVWFELGCQTLTPPEMATAAVGAHPTGMHSCLI